jgi:hypothetical protein
MRIATLVCPSVTVLAGVLLKANGDRHTLLSPVQPAYWLCWLALTLQRRRCHQTQQFAGRIADALWPIVHVLPLSLPASSVITRQKGKTRMTQSLQQPSTTTTFNSHRKQWKQRLPTSAGVNCCCWLQGHGRYRNSNNSSPRPHWRVGALVPSNDTWREHRLGEASV